jgi:single-stranded-DNA-specific exonuclease
MRTPDEIIEQVLASRGITDRDEFFSDAPRVTHDPFLLPDMEAGADIVHSHILQGKNICVYGDYDVDGLMSVMLLTEFLSKLPGAAKENISWYVPSRFDEGYGLNDRAIERIRRDGADLIITVDCGVAPAAEVNAAVAAGMAVVVTDHHDPDPANMPSAVTIDPKVPGSSYPFTGLCGCGVAFKLAQAIRTKFYPEDPDIREALNATLDLVAVATVADVMPLTDENRTLVKYGLKAIGRGDRWQLRELVKGIGLKGGDVASYNIAFGIAPHINAAGRMGDVAPVIDLLRAVDRAKACEMVTELIERNTQRRAVQEEAFAECAAIIDEIQPDDDFLFVRPSSVHEGVAGIVAGKIKEKYGRPVIVLSRSGEGEECVLKGSARSVAGVDIISLIRRYDELFLRYGGHAMAAGFTIKPENEQILYESLRSDIEALAAEDPGLFSSPSEIDADIRPEECTIELARLLKGFEPTGAGNPRPVMRISSQMPERIRTIGADGRHMKFTIRGLECVLFARGGEAASLPEGEGPLDLYGYLDVNVWNGRENVQFIVREVSCSKSQS